MPADVSRLSGWGRPRLSADPTVARIPAKRITINLDRDIVAHFKAEALRGGPPYQVGINQALRRYLHEAHSRSEGDLIASILAALDNARVRRKILALRALRRHPRRRGGRPSLATRL